MTINTYTVTAGDNPWKVVQRALSDSKTNYTDSDIWNILNNLAKENGCDSIDEFKHKYFAGIGKTFSCDSLMTSPISEPYTDATSPVVKDFDIKVAGFDTMDGLYNKDSSYQKPIGFYEKAENWSTIKTQYDTINNLSSDKEKIIEYRRSLCESKDNYVIVDKKNYTATVYTSDGQVVKEFEVGVAKNKTDALLRRSEKNKENNFESTTAGIYTINYRASGRDAYSRKYNDRVFTLSNDGLRAKGVGNGETGVALHQIPKGNTYRRYLLDQEGVSDQNNRFSSGCVNFREEDFDELAECINGVGTKVYILPEDDNNYMTVKNGELHYFQKNYTGDVATTTTKNDTIKKININAKDDKGGESEIMMRTLSDMKAELARELGLDNDTYNELAMLTLGIAEQESEFGKWNAFKYHIKEACPWTVKVGKCLKRLCGKKVSPIDSRGLTQMKLGSYNNEKVLDLMDKYGITNSNLGNGDKSAIGTMIVLASIYKDELPAIKELMEEQNVSKTDALLYCWQGKKSLIKNGDATPDANGYIVNVKSYMNNFEITQYS